jgi:D-3-phosphoglycerate dehydrogenase
MIDAAALEALKPGAVLVNVARGPLIDEQALAEALASGRLDAAALDVTPQEPPAPESPLWTAPRLLLTPHVAGQSACRIDTMTDFFCANLEKFLSGRTLRNLVDKRLGFPPPVTPSDGPRCDEAEDGTTRGAAGTAPQ